MGTMGIPRNLLVSRRDGYEYCGNTAGMDLTIAGFSQGGILLWQELCSSADDSESRHSLIALFHVVTNV